MAVVTVTWQRGAEPRLGLRHLCPRCGGSDHGRPLTEDGTFVSLSHSGDLHVVATTAAGPVGVDVEAIDAARFVGFDEVALHRSERPHAPVERATTWVRKEALLKATGDGLAVDPRLIRLSDPDAPPAVLEWSGGPGSVHLVDVEIGEGYRAAVCLIGSEAPEVTVRRATP